jgi:hypothetical protein
MSSSTKNSGTKNSAKKNGSAKGAKASVKASAKPSAKAPAKSAKPAAKVEAAKLSCLDAAAMVLKSAGKPMRCKEMIDAMFTAKLWHSDAPTPAATLSSALLREITTKGKEARFQKTERGHFGLRA